MNKLITSLFYILLVFHCFEGKSQDIQKNNQTPNTIDSIYEIAESAKTEMALNIKSNALFRDQNNLYNSINIEIQKANILLKKKIDYNAYSNEFKIILDWKEKATKGITYNTNKNLTSSDLTTTSILLDEILNRTNFWLEKIRLNNDKLTKSQISLDSLASNKNLYIVPKDPEAKEIYFQRYLILTQKLKPVYSRINLVLDSIQTFQIYGNILKLNIESDLSLTNSLKKDAFSNLSKKKINLFNSNNGNTLYNTIFYSLEKSIMVFVFYILNHVFIIVLMFLFFLGLIFYLKLLKQKYIKTGIYQELNSVILIFRYPIASSIIITTTIFQFILPSLPFLFTSLLWFSALLAISLIVFRSKSDTILLKIWFLLLPIYFLAIFVNLLIIYSVIESWLILILAISTSFICIFGIINRKEINNNFIVYSLYLSLILNVISIYFLFYGLYDLSKIIMTNGVYTLLILTSFLYTYHLFMDILKFTNHLNLSEEDKRTHPLIEEITNNISKKIYLLFFIGWFFIIKRDNYSLTLFFEPLVAAFYEPRQIGDFTFSYINIFLFIFILILAGIISRIVSFLTSDNTSSTTDITSSKIGSWMLLVRIGIICCGFLIAFASAGIPLDKITIIISALGIGIGFGLQTLVNNLVSGLIIALEKPVNLNDVVDIGGQTGKMKSIGIRSSIISTYDGSDVIIPNGDLLNKNLINWTLSNSKRRFDIKVGVAYGTDLEKTTQLLRELIAENKNVVKYPPTAIQVVEFNQSSIDFLIRFWVGHFDIGLDVKSDVIKSIDVMFKENNIIIPFSQHDIHIINKNEQNNNEGESK